MNKDNERKEMIDRSRGIITDLLTNEPQLEEVVRGLTEIKYALDQSSIVAITNRYGTILSVNDRFCQISQYTEDELIGQNHRILNSGYHDSAYFKEMWHTISEGKTWRGELKNKAKDGNTYWVDTTIVPLFSGDDKPQRYISIRTDISPRKAKEQKIKENEEMFRVVTENSSDLILMADLEGEITYISPSHKKQFNIYDLDDTSKEFINNKLDFLLRNNQQSMSLEFRVREDEPDYVDLKIHIRAIFDSSGKIRNFLLVIKDVTEQKKDEQTIQHLAYHDALTDLPNRRYFIGELTNIILEKRKTCDSFAVLLINIDRFKYINDSMGHELGDYILIKVAERLQAMLEPSEQLSRLGGDEFGMILKNTKDNETAALIAQRILNTISQPILLASRSYTLSSSIGLSLFPEDGLKSDEILNNTDTALTSVKERGGGGYAFYSREMNQKSLERIMLENQLKKAIELKQFFLEYQPIIDISTKEIIGAEALVRWSHPDLGRIPPNNFIAIAEETGLILPLGKWVLTEACQQNKAWQDQGYPPFIIAVNISVKQLMHPEIVSDIKQILEEAKLEPQWLEIEVTESTFANLTYASGLLQEIREYGIRISIDDFGTGYSSFNYIKWLPIDTLKIDGSFIRDIHENKDSYAIVKAMLTLSNTLDINVIAECIEVKEQVDLLLESGCHLGQGYLFSRPVLAEGFEVYLDDQFDK